LSQAAGIRRGECWNRISDASGVGFESSGAGSESASFPLPSEMIELGPGGVGGGELAVILVIFVPIVSRSREL